MSPLPVIIIGAGGHARVVADALLLSGRSVLGYTDAAPVTHGESHLGITVLGADEILAKYPSSSVDLANGLGSVRDTVARAGVFKRFSELGYRFTVVRHPSAILSAHILLGAGVQLMAGSVVQVGTQIDDNALVNTSASIDHDCRIGANVHIAPGAVLSGAVRVGADTHIGTGARIIQGIHIGKGCTIGAGAVVIQDIPDNTTAFGVPAQKRQL